MFDIEAMKSNDPLFMTISGIRVDFIWATKSDCKKRVKFVPAEKPMINAIAQRDNQAPLGNRRVSMNRPKINGIRRNSRADSGNS